MFWIIQNQANILGWSMEFLALLFCIHGIFGEKYKISGSVVIMIVIDVIIYSAILEGILHPAFTIMTHFLVFLYCIKNFKRKIGIIIFYYIVSITIIAVIEIFVTYLAVPFEKALSSEKYLMLFFNGSTLLLSILLYQFLPVDKKIRYLLEEKGIFFMIMICGIAIIFILVDYRYRGNFDRIYYLVFLGLTLLIVSFYIKVQKAKFELEKKKLELKMQEVYGMAYKELIFEVRRRQHDFQNQLGAIYSMHITATSLEDLVKKQQEYGNSLLKENRYDKILTGCNNPILAGYLYNKCVGFESSNVRVEYQIHTDMAECSLSLHEIIEILGILLNNALESVIVQKTEGKIIELVVEETLKNLNIQVCNPSPYLTRKEIEKIFKPGYSSKGENRGIGLARIKQLAEKCSADLIVENRILSEENWIMFQMAIKK